jgi:hypothetical protein
MRWIRPFVIVLLLAAAGSADENSWEQLNKLQQQLRRVESDVRSVDDQLWVLRERVPSDRSAELASARVALEKAQRDRDKVHTSAGLDKLRDRLRDAQGARDDKATELITASPLGKQAVERYEKTEGRIDELTAKTDRLTRKEVAELARLRREHRHLGRKLYGIRRAVWERREVLAHYRRADAAYKAYSRAKKKSKEYDDAADRLKKAKKHLAKVLAGLELDGAAARELKQRKTVLQQRREELDANVKALRKKLLDGAKEYSLTIEMPPKKGKPRKPRRVTLWIPPVEQVRGVIVAHPMISKMATHPRIRQAAARAGLATTVVPNYAYNGHETVKRFDDMLARFAAKSGHPELKGAALLPAGLSASVLAARNVGYAAPERTLGIVHVAGGNMHHNIVDPNESLTGVPFIAMNGEFEWCGPEGGIRPEFGRQTQWVMIREQLLRRWRKDHQHLMSLVVVPGGDHGAWDVELAAMFVRKAAEYRAPKGKRDGSKPATCRTIKAEDGWLSSADITDPEHKPAPFKEYTGEKDYVFWHFDGEMARAVREYHDGELLLPDPTDEVTIPTHWPEKKWKKQ